MAKAKRKVKFVEVVNNHANGGRVGVRTVPIAIQEPHATELSIRLNKVITQFLETHAAKVSTYEGGCVRVTL